MTEWGRDDIYIYILKLGGKMKNGKWKRVRLSLFLCVSLCRLLSLRNCWWMWSQRMEWDCKVWSVKWEVKLNVEEWRESEICVIDIWDWGGETCTYNWLYHYDFAWLSLSLPLYVLLPLPLPLCLSALWASMDDSLRRITLLNYLHHSFIVLFLVLCFTPFSISPKKAITLPSFSKLILREW